MPISTNKKILIHSGLFVLTAIVLLFPEYAFAQNALFDSGTNFLNALMTLLTSTWARIIATIAVFCVGVAWVRGRAPWELLVSVTIGLILMFGAPAIVDSISGSLG